MRAAACLAAGGWGRGAGSGGAVPGAGAAGRPLERRQVAAQGVQVAQGPGAVGLLGPLGQLLDGEAALGVVPGQGLDELLAVGVGGAQRGPPLVSLVAVHGQLLAAGVRRPRLPRTGPGYAHR